MFRLSLDAILDIFAPNGVVSQLEEDIELFFTDIQLYEPNISEKNRDCLYVCRYEDITADILKSKCFFLCVQEEALRPIPPDLSQCVVSVYGEGIRFATVFNRIQRLFFEIREWHKNMHISVIRGDSIQTLLDMSAPIIGNPIVLVDLSFCLLAYTQHITSDDEIYNDLIRRGYHSHQTVEKLTKYRQISDFKTSTSARLGFPQAYSKYPTVTRTFYDGETPGAYLRMICSTKEPSKRVIELFDLMWESVEYYLANDLFSGRVNRSMSEYVLVDFIKGNLPSEEIYMERCKSINLSFTGDYQMLQIHFMDEENASLLYTVEYLQTIILESRPFIYNDNVMVLLHHTKSGLCCLHRDEGSYTKLENFLIQNTACAGLSRPFSKMARAKDAYTQTTMAISLGQRLQNVHPEWNNRLFCYPDYYTYHMIEACSQQMSLESLCDHNLLLLREQDRQKHTEHTKLLYTYLTQNCRATDTAKVLHMHRNNVIYHIERICQQMEYELEDAEVRLRLLIAFKVLDMISPDGPSVSEP